MTEPKPHHATKHDAALANLDDLVRSGRNGRGGEPLHEDVKAVLAVVASICRQEYAARTPAATPDPLREAAQAVVDAQDALDAIDREAQHEWDINGNDWHDNSVNFDRAEAARARLDAARTGLRAALASVPAPTLDASPVDPAAEPGFTRLDRWADAERLAAMERVPVPDAPGAGPLTAEEERTLRDVLASGDTDGYAAADLIEVIARLLATLDAVRGVTVSPNLAAAVEKVARMTPGAPGFIKAWQDLRAALPASPAPKEPTA